MKIAAGYWDGKLIIWDGGTGKAIYKIEGYTAARSDTNGLSWSPDGTLLATAHQDGFVRLWNPNSGQLVREINAHAGWVRGIAWSPDGRMLASSGEDKRGCIWNPINAELITCITHNFMPVWSVAWSPSGEYFSTGSGVYDNARPGVTIVWSIKSIE